MNPPIKTPPDLHEGQSRNSSARWARSMTGRRDEARKGDYFPVEALRKQMEAIRWPPKLRFNDGHEAIVDKAIEALQREGITRIKYLSSGNSSLVFETVPDQEGRMQLVSISPAELIKHSPPHPMMLPDIKRHDLTVGGYARVMVRISPKIRQDEVTDSHVLQLYDKLACDKAIEPCDFVPSNLRHERRNIGLVQGADGKWLPFMLDLGSVEWRVLSSPNNHKHIERWEQDPVLAPWRELREELMKKTEVENTMTAERFDVMGEETAQSMARKNGLYPGDLKKLVEDTKAELIGEEGEDPTLFSLRLKSKIRRFDTTVEPAPYNMPSKSR